MSAPRIGDIVAFDPALASPQIMSGHRTVQHPVKRYVNTTTVEIQTSTAMLHRVPLQAVRVVRTLEDIAQTRADFLALKPS